MTPPNLVVKPSANTRARSNTATIFSKPHSISGKNQKGTKNQTGRLRINCEMPCEHPSPLGERHPESDPLKK